MGDIEKPPSYAEHESAGDALVVRIASHIADVPAADWDGCALAGRPYNPFISHDFLKALEESGSATRDTGWLPQHLLLEDASGALIGCMPCYLKSHSQGAHLKHPRAEDAAAASRCLAWRSRSLPTPQERHGK